MNEIIIRNINSWMLNKILQTLVQSELLLSQRWLILPLTGTIRRNQKNRQCNWTLFVIRLQSKTKTTQQKEMCSLFLIVLPSIWAFGESGYYDLL